MKKQIFLILPLLLLTIGSFSQCGDYVNYLMPGLSNVKFWDDNNGFVQGPRSLMTTHDGGQTWESYEPFLNGYKKVAIISNESGIIVGGQGFILHTTNKGVTWQREVGLVGNEGYADVFVLNDEILFLTGTILNSNFSRTPFLYKSDDGGLTWFKIEIDFQGFSSGLNPRRVFFFDENVGFITDDQRIYKTIDGGVNWVESENPGGYELISEYQVIDNQTAFLKTTNGLFKTVNQGDSWSIILEENEFYENAFFVKNEFLYYGQFVLGGIKKRNLNTGIVESAVINLPAKLTDVYFIDAQNGFAVGSDYYNDNISRFIYKTTDGGLTWLDVDSGVTLSGGASVYGYFAKMETDKFVYSSWDYGSIDKSYVHLSEDNGITWKLVKKVENTTGKILFSTDNYLSHFRYANGNNHADDFIISESFDSGETWQDNPVFSFPRSDLAVEHLKQVSENDLFVYRLDYLYHSIDKGVTWELISIPSIAGGGKYFFKNENEFVLYAKNPSTDNPVFYKTIDGGQTWIFVGELYYTYDLYDDIIQYTSNDELVVYSGNANIIYNFNLISGSSSYVTTGLSIDQLAILDENIYIATSGSGYFISYDQGDNWIEKEDIFVENESELYGKDLNNIFLWSANEIKHLKDYSPNTPEFIAGNTDALVNTEEEYLIPANFFAETYWELESGGDLILDSETSHFKAKVLWYNAGQHTLRVKHLNDCGESTFTSIVVNVENDIVVDDLPLDNFLIGTTSETCSNLNNGSLNILAEENRNYEFILSLNSVEVESGSFDQMILIENLESGHYELCISIENTGIERCFSITISEPEDIQGKSAIDQNNYSIKLTGARHYFINVNEEEYELLAQNENEEVEFFTVLNQNINRIIVKSDKNCQDPFMETVVLKSDVFTLFPNPTHDSAFISLHSEKDTGHLNIFNVTGQLLKTSKIILPISNYEVDFSSYQSGFYLLLLETKDGVYQTKILKK
jgi:photosystem II stability/assembly factor-like uncharacterized protein